MTLNEAAKLWGMSPNWVRELVKSRRVPARFRTDSPVHYYEIPDGTPRPVSMQRSPLRKGSALSIKPASFKRRESRAADRPGPASRRLKPRPEVAVSAGATRTPRWIETATTVLEVAERANSLLASGKTLAEVAKSLGRAQDYVRDTVRLRDAADDVVELLRAGELSWSVVRLVIRRPREEQSKLAARVRGLPLGKAKLVLFPGSAPTPPSAGRRKERALAVEVARLLALALNRMFGEERRRQYAEEASRRLAELIPLLES